MDPASFAEVLRRYPLAVSIVTVGRGGAENALTVSWATPCSFDPPMFLVAVDRLHYSVDFVKSTRNFAVNVLGEGQERLAGQDAYLDIVRHWLKSFGISRLTPQARRAALQFALGRGSRSGRVAWQFAHDWAGQQGLGKTLR